MHLFLLAMFIFVSPFSLYYVIMSCMYIIIGCQLWWTFLSGSLPLLYYFKLLLLCIYFWQIKYLIWYGKICPKTPPKRGVNRQFQAKTPKSIHRNISGTITLNSDELAIWGPSSDQERHFVGGPHYPKANTTWLTAAILKIDMTSYFGNVCSDLNEIRQPDAEQHADYGEMVEMETGSRIPIWRTLVIQNRK